MMRGSDLQNRFLMAIGLLSVSTIVMQAIRIVYTGNVRYWFVPENLVLAWLGLFWAWFLGRELKRRRWLSWQNLGITALWLFFLPNTWYVLTDFIHIYPNGEISQLFDIVLMSLLLFCGFILGITSLFLVHRQLLKRLSQLRSYLLIELAIFTSSFAIYLGRDLRWNSWDIIRSPQDLVVNVSDRILDPLGSPRAVNVTLLFFLLISLIYFCFWIISRPPAKR